ncbi:hypothetical protein GPECTOR_1g42 [Gonium pectorale]|uniref:glutathione gamma-glutamylcysteinyltransferase n=1 Tax=Gonium pectorale TaxID=33097 RepID=A0A150H2S6_GONPE|nr:hypothetical protein GPECTOR_1g42 [Gonium pectorale]|eukprot:KXZ56469.1 hypothetical protein GPECTOR_1g42 [Gonium pectorale]
MSHPQPGSPMHAASSRPYSGLQQGFSIPQATSSPATAHTTPHQQTAGFKKTFYKRKLPSPPAIEFSSKEGRQLFQEALLEGSMVGFFKLMEQFNTQDEPAFCGLASLAMVLNALSIDPRRTWKGAWRWFHEAMLDCCRPLDIVKEEGITLYQASCLARCNGARVELRPYGSTSLEAFREEVASVCRSEEEHVVVSYSRKAFLQTGDGHFSPIGGYHRGRDLALVLDVVGHWGWAGGGAWVVVARFKYPPHWVPLPLLYHAMSYIDPETGRPRGYMRLSSNPLLDSVLLTLDVRSSGWRAADEFVRAGAPALVQELAARGGLSGEDVVRRVVDAMPLESLDAFLVVRSGAPLGPAASASASLDSTAEAEVANGAGGGGGNGSGAAVAAEAAVGAPVCGTPEEMTAAARRASVMGTAAATEAARATAEASSSAAAVPPPPLPKIATGTPRNSFDTVGFGSNSGAIGSGGGGCGTKGSASDGGAALADGGGAGRCRSCNSGNSSSLMAAATAIFTAHDRCIPMAQRQALLAELRAMPLYTIVSGHLAARATAAAAGGADVAAAAAAAGLAPPASEYLAEKVVMSLLMQRPEAWPAAEGWADAGAGAQWGALMGPAGYSVAEAEAAYLREQLTHIDEVLQTGDVTSTCGEHSSRLDCAAHGH